MLKKLKKRVAKGFTLVEMALSKYFCFGQEKSRLLTRPLDLPVNI